MIDSPALPTLAKTFDLQSLADTEALAVALATRAAPHDVIALSGGLGAGKTTFARGFIRARPGGEAVAEVPSPTFTLVQVYELPGVPVWHFDLYRLVRPEDAWELGIEEAFAEAISLIEWPDRLGALLPESRLDVELVLGRTSEARRATVTGRGAWAARVESLER
jgi:tRNA threonylcarbamoyladenosine biosynthesis protein TsaE